MKKGIDCIGICTAFNCIDGEGNFLLMKRGEKARDEQGTWENGGGSLKFGSDLKNNVLRELKEELGCAGEIIEELPTTEVFRDFDGIKTHWIVFEYVIKVNPEEIKLMEPEVCDEIKWFKWEEFPKNLHSGYSQTLKEHGHILEKYSK